MYSIKSIIESVSVCQLVEETSVKTQSEASSSQEVQQQLNKAEEEMNKTKEELSTLKEEMQKKQDEVSHVFI